MFVGEPQTGCVSVVDFVCRVEFEVANLLFWDNPVSQTTYKVLVFGHQTITNNSIVANFGEEQGKIPLFYLYALPVSASGVFGSYGQATLDMSVGFDRNPESLQSQKP